MDEPTPCRKQLDDLIRLTKGREPFTLPVLRQCEALLDLLHLELNCPEEQHEELPRLLQTILTKIVALKRLEALDGFKCHGAQLDEKSPYSTAACIAGFGELLSLSEPGLLDQLAGLRGEPGALVRAREESSAAKRRQRYAGLWSPKKVVEDRQVRRNALEFDEGEPIWTAAMLDALNEYLRENAANLRAQLAQLTVPRPNGKPDHTGSLSRRPYFLAAAILVAVSIITSVTLIWVKQTPPSPPTVNLRYVSGDRPKMTSESFVLWKFRVDGDRTVRTVLRPVDRTVQLKSLEGSLEVQENPNDPCGPSTYIGLTVELDGVTIASGNLGRPSEEEALRKMSLQTATPRTSVDEIEVRMELHSDAEFCEIVLLWQSPHFVGVER